MKMLLYYVLQCEVYEMTKYNSGFMFNHNQTVC